MQNSKIKEDQLTCKLKFDWNSILSPGNGGLREIALRLREVSVHFQNPHKDRVGIQIWAVT